MGSRGLLKKMNSRIFLYLPLGHIIDPDIRMVLFTHLVGIGCQMNNHMTIFEESTGPLDQQTARRALDELFELSREYRLGKEYFDLLQFISRFKSYSIFNALLVHVQMPGAKYVAPASRWKRDFGMDIRLGARPLVILQPMGPVMFVYDVSDTKPGDGAKPLPPQVTNPFAVKEGFIGDELDRTIENAKRDGVMVTDQNAGSLRAGSIQTMEAGQTVKFIIRRKPQLEWQSIPLRYGILLNAKHSPETQYATLAHELAHLYCGHLGTPNEKWWPTRRGLAHDIEELEAESVCYLVCQRLRIENPSEKYISTYAKDEKQIKNISLDCIIKAATLIEHMGRTRLTPRKAHIPMASEDR
jgi:hypothetical protein